MSALPLLQLPGGAELIIVLVVLVIGLAILVGSILATYWVYKDATRRGDDNAIIWTVLTALGFFIGLIPGLIVVAVYALVVRK
ncbi:hypothetical protein [Haloarcula marina]|uniref:hypothetical protein n=1 Tax=Haloarcula marina TaxID=2961574 RepID=UPI0020B88223|nr:hypothetical protein [Halomicroarcula marina]